MNVNPLTLQAIQTMDPQHHMYLTVTGQGIQQHLTVCKRTFLDRIWMWLGFSSSSMEKIAEHIIAHQHAFQTLDPTLTLSLREKLSRFYDRHKTCQVAQEALIILSSPLQMGHSTSKETPITPPSFTSVLRKAIRAKFLESAPEVDFLTTPLKINHFKTTERERLEAFLKTQQPGSHDVVYVCLGAGEEQEQVWPGFVFDTLVKGKKIKNFLFEVPNWKFNGTYVEMLDIYRHAYRIDLKDDEFRVEKDPFCHYVVRNYTVFQFLCGFPNSAEGDPRDPLTEEKTNILIANFEAYIQKELEAGATVVLGDHRADIKFDQQLVRFYNELYQKFPGKVHFLWAHEKKNLLCSQALKQEDCQLGKHQAAWTYYPNLGRCLLTASS